MKRIDGNIQFETLPRIVSFASVAGKKEGEGPLRGDFDRLIDDSYVGQDTFEQGESELMRTALSIAMDKARLSPADIGIAYCGDLLNQCVASSFAFNGMPVPYAGIYGACSTMALGLILSALTVDGGAAQRAVCAASSHYCTAERQYRFPLEYGSQRPPTAQWTVTGAGACIAASSDSPETQRGIQAADGAVPYIHSARIGVITDMGVTDQNNMGAAMAPAIVK